MRREYPKIVLEAIGRLHSIDLFAYDSLDYQLSIYPWTRQPALGPRQNIDLTKGTEAETLLSAAIKMCPARFDAYWYRCQVRFLLRKDKEAVQDLDEVIRLAPDHVPALFLKASVHRRAGEHQRHDDIFEEASGKADDPDSWQHKWLKAQLAMQASNRRAAVMAYPNAIAVKPEPYIGWELELCHQYSIALHGTRDPENRRDAQRQLTVVGNQWPAALDVRVAEASILYELKDEELAKKLLEELYLEGRNPTQIAASACWEHTRGIRRAYCQPDDDYMDKWLARIDDDPALRELYRGRFLIASGRRQAGLAALRKAIELRPDCAKLYYALALELWGTTNGAIAPMQEAVQLEPNNVAYRAALSFFLAKANPKRTAEAREQLLMVPHINHRRMWEGIYTGLALGALGDIEAANRVFDQLSHTNRNQLIEHNRGEMLFRAAEGLAEGELRERLLRASIDANDKVILQNPRFTPAHHFKIAALRSLGEHDKAVVAYKAFAGRGDRLSPSDLRIGARCYSAAFRFAESLDLNVRLLKERHRTIDTCDALTAMLETERAGTRAG